MSTVLDLGLNQRDTEVTQCLPTEEQVFKQNRTPANSLRE